jgi:hypothetical protein
MKSLWLAQPDLNRILDVGPVSCGTVPIKRGMIALCPSCFSQILAQVTSQLVQHDLKLMPLRTQERRGFVDSIRAGGPDETSQRLTFQVSFISQNSNLFAQSPTIDLVSNTALSFACAWHKPRFCSHSVVHSHATEVHVNDMVVKLQDGTLRFESKPNEFGEATVSVRLRDDGGTYAGGADVNVRAMPFFCAVDAHAVPSSHRLDLLVLPCFCLRWHTMSSSGIV